MLWKKPTQSKQFLLRYPVNREERKLKSLKKTNLIGEQAIISILEILYVPIFSQNGQLWLFHPKFGQSWILGSEFQKSKSGFEISTSKIWTIDNFEFFGLNLGKLPNYVRYFGYKNVVGVAESWVEAEMNWVEVDPAGRRWMKLAWVGCTV